MPSPSLVKVEDAPASTRDPLIGLQLGGRYVIERVHGRGGTSTVYAGVHEELQSEVAIKVLDHESAADPLAVERFELEARLGSSLAHGNVVGVSDFGRLPDGRPFLVMPMIAGIDMATLLAQEGPQHPRRVAKLLQGVASALGLMHEQGLVHRDIKSENLMHVVHEDGTETALVLDFGIAASRAPNADASADSSGTPEFMPPEAWSGQPSDYRGDIYALATVAFELMTGSLPFEGQDPAELREKKTTQPARSLAEAGERDFPAALEVVLARGLAQRPSDRPASASEFITALEAAAEVMPEWPKRPPPRRRASTHPTLVGTGSGIHDRASLGMPPLQTREQPTTGAPAEALRDVASVSEQRLDSPASAASDPVSMIAPRLDVSSAAASSGLSPRAATLKRLSERAASISLSIPPPPPLGAEPPLPVPAAMALSASLRALAQQADGQQVGASAEPAAAPANVPRPLALDDGTAPALRDYASFGDAAPSQPAPRLDEFSLDIGDDPFGHRQPRGRLVVYAAVGGLALALVIWQGTRSSAPPPVTVASTLATPHVDAPAPVVEPPAPVVEAPVPAAAQAPAVVAAATTEPANAAGDEAAAPVHVPDAPTSSGTAPAHPSGASTSGTAPALRGGASTSGTAPALRGGAASHASRATASSSKDKKATPAPVLQITKRAERDARPTEPAASKVSRGKDSERARALTEQATDATLRSDFAAAANLYQEAIKADASYAPAWRGKALVLERTGRTHDAAAAFRQFLKLAPNGAAADKIRERLKALEAAP
jgi:serine/threonine protein kinase